MVCGPCCAEFIIAGILPCPIDKASCMPESLIGERFRRPELLPRHTALEKERMSRACLTGCSGRGRSGRNRRPVGSRGCELRWMPERPVNRARPAQPRWVLESQGRTDLATAQPPRERTDSALEVASSQVIGPTLEPAASTLSCGSRNADTPAGGRANCPIPATHRVPKVAGSRKDGLDSA